MAAVTRLFLWRCTIFKGYSSKDFSQRFFSVSQKTSSQIKYSQLKARGLVKVSGKDAVKFLQGLVTNNVELFHEDRNQKAMYSMFLNVQGRALFDTIFFKLRNESENPSFFIEHDKSLTSQLLDHMKMYKLRSKVEMSMINELFPWVIFSSVPSDMKLDENPCEGAIAMARDPRNEELGIRLILPEGKSPTSLFSTAKECEEEVYDQHRAKLGVCEGAIEIPSGSAIPLEYNLAYLNGGCYIGQELTARSHHTGVIRKRAMPFSLSNSTQNISFEPALKTKDGKSAGKMCVMHGAYGLAMIRLEALKKGKLFIKDTNGNDHEILPDTPQWWPKEEEKHSRT